MKRVILLGMAVLVSNVVLAQAPAGSTSSVTSAAAHATTNSANLRVELRDIQTKLYPAEQKLMEKDPEIKAMVVKRRELQTALFDLDKKKKR